MKETGVQKGLQIGLWIDHKATTLVFVENGALRVERVESQAESHYYLSDGRRSAGESSVAQSVSTEQRVDERRKHQYHNFYQQLIKMIEPANSILIMGPGEAKREFEEEIKAVKRFRAKMITVETADQLSGHQLVAKVRTFFL